MPSLRELVPPERIALEVEVSDWREAIRVAGRLLLRTGVIDESYINAMLRVAEELNQYIVIAPGIAMPHARPEDGALGTALSLVTLKKPINFGNPDHDPVRLVVALVAMDKSIHLRAIRTLAHLFMSEDLVRGLMQAKTKEDVYSTFDRAETLDGME